MQRYFIEAIDQKNNTATITGADVHHIKNVMRSKIGDQIIVCDGSSCFMSSITFISNDVVEVELLEQTQQQRKTFKVTIAQAMIRRERFEYMLQKATELGVDEIIPIQTTNSIIKLKKDKVDSKINRWNTILKEASEQSHRMNQAVINQVTSLKELDFTEYDAVLVAYEREHQSSALKSLLKTAYKNILVIIGPEGGFTPQEIESLEAKENVHLVGLGPRILRSETASSYILSAISYEYELGE